MTKEEKLIKKYAEISEYVFSYCQKLKCTEQSKKLGLCCDRYQCEMVWDDLRGKGITIHRERKTMTFIRHGRCAVPPHLRPLCAVHACDRLQMFAGKKFMDHYLKLRCEVEQVHHDE